MRGLVVPGILALAIVLLILVSDVVLVVHTAIG